MRALAQYLRPFTLLFVAFVVRQSAEGDEDEDGDSDFYAGQGEPGHNDDGDHDGEGGDGNSDNRGPTSVFIMEHGFLQGEPDWQPRGTLLLSGSGGERGGGFEARLSDAKEFVQLRPELPKMMSEAATAGRYHAVRMYNPESPKRVLQAAIPAHLLADHFDDWHDILEVTMSSTGLPVGLSYRVRHTLGLSLFDHTQVHLSEPSLTEGPRLPADTRDPAGAQGGAGGAGGAGGGAKQEPQGTQSLLRKYWWVIIIVLLLVSSAGDSGGTAAAGGGGGKAAGGKSAGGRRG